MCNDFSHIAKNCEFKSCDDFTLSYLTMLMSLQLCQHVYGTHCFTKKKALTLHEKLMKYMVLPMILGVQAKMHESCISLITSPQGAKRLPFFLFQGEHSGGKHAKAQNISIRHSS